VSIVSIRRVGSFLASSSSDSGANPAFSPSLQSRRRAPPPAAASVRRAAGPSPLLVRVTAGEARLHPLRAVRAFPGPLWPCFAVPPRAAAAVAARARARVAPRACRGRAPGRVKAAGLALTRPGGQLARGPRLSAPGLAGWGVPSNFS
jgi:hypothetical protein